MEGTEMKKSLFKDNLSYGSPEYETQMHKYFPRW